jgi:hypothetical protein
MSDGFSYALSILRTGITGYFAPCGANNANDQGEDVYNAFLYHEPLGDIQKRSNDGVVMGFLGNSPNLMLYAQGASGYGCDVLASGSFNPDDWSGACYMLGGKANRIYFGDPMFNPYQNNHSDSLNIAKTVIDSVNATTLDIDLAFNKPAGFWPMWDKFHFGDTRIYVPVELPSYCGELTTFAVIDSSGPYSLIIHAVEHFDGKTILHIEADIPNDIYAKIDYDIKFRITYVMTGTANYSAPNQQISVFPNPSDYATTIRFAKPGNNDYTLIIYDAMGQIVQKIYNITTGQAIVNENRNFIRGIYFFRLLNCNGTSGLGKFIIE